MNNKSHLQKENKTSQLTIKIYPELPQEMKEDISRNIDISRKMKEDISSPFFLWT